MGAHPRIAEALSASGDWWIVGTNPADALLVRGGDNPVAVRVSSASGADLVRLLDDANRGLAAAAEPAQPPTAIGSPGTAPRIAKPKAPRLAAAPAKPAPAKPEPRAPAASEGAGRGELRERAEVQNATAGILVRLTAEEESITYRGEAMELTARQALLASILTPASPQPVDRQFVINRMWRGQPVATAETVLTGICGELRAAIAALGLDVVVTRGVGIAIAPKGDA